MEPTGEKDSGKMMVGMGHMLLGEIKCPLFKGRKGEILVATKKKDIGRRWSNETMTPM